MASVPELIAHQTALRACRRCPSMIGPVVTGEPVASPVLLIGQAPGVKEGGFGKPFAWTAGKTLFKWFESIGLVEAEFRRRVYMSAVCRCYPGKNPKGGDRVPTPVEVANCSHWLDREIALLQPSLIIPVGKLAINRFLPNPLLNEVVGRAHAATNFDLIPLPHPSGASPWHRIEPGRTLLRQALELIAAHPAWHQITQIIEP